MRKLRRMSRYMENKYSCFEAVDKEDVESQLEEVVDDIFDKLPDASAVKAPRPKVESYRYSNVNEGLMKLLFGDKMPKEDSIKKFVSQGTAKIVDTLVSKLKSLANDLMSYSIKNKDIEKKPYTTNDIDKLVKLDISPVNKDTLRFSGTVKWLDNNWYVTKKGWEMNGSFVVALTKDQTLVCNVKGILSKKVNDSVKSGNIADSTQVFQTLNNPERIFKFIQSSLTNVDAYDNAKNIH